MASPPWAETATKVVVEFKKTSGLVHRTVTLSHARDQMPQQLQQRLPAEVWSNFMTEAEALAQQHPFGWKAEDGVFSWCGGYLCILCIAIGRVLGDDRIAYQIWMEQAQAVVAKQQPAFAPYGATLCISGIHGSQWIQIDLAPGPPVHGPGAYPGGPGPMMMLAPGFAGPAGPIGPW